MLIPYNLRFCIKKHRYIICRVGQKLKTELRERFWSCSNSRRYTGLLHPNTGQHKILSLVHLINQIGQRDKTKNDVWLHININGPHVIMQSSLILIISIKIHFLENFGNFLFGFLLN